MSAQLQPGEAEERGFEGGEPMTLMEHLRELRNRLMVTAFGIAITTVFSFLFTDQLLKFLLIPGQQAHKGFKPIFITPTQSFSVYFEIALLAGVALAMPVIIYEILMFVTPALTKRERRWVFPIVVGAFAFFVLGVVFAYYVALEPAFKFFLNFGNDYAVPQITIGEYIDFVTHIVFWSGLFFETPLVMMGLAALGVMSARRYLHYWRFAVVLGFVCAALIIPAISPLAQILVAAPIIGLYFLGVALARIVERPSRFA